MNVDWNQRLTQQQHALVAHHHLRERHALLFAAGHSPDHVVAHNRVRSVPQAKDVQHVIHLVRDVIASSSSSSSLWTARCVQQCRVLSQWKPMHGTTVVWRNTRSS